MAAAIKADKLVYLTDSKGVTDQSGELLDAMTADEASQLLRDADWLSADIRRYFAVCRARQPHRRRQVKSDQFRTGRRAVAGTSFTHDGVGTVVTRESLENIREAGRHSPR